MLRIFPIHRIGCIIADRIHLRYQRYPRAIQLDLYLHGLHREMLF